MSVALTDSQLRAKGMAQLIASGMAAVLASGARTDAQLAEYIKAPNLPIVDEVRAIAKELGWGIGAHGSMVRDIDLIGVPWTNEACSAEVLVRTLMERLGMTRRGTNMGKRAHGRLTYLLLRDDAVSQQERFNEGLDPGPVHPKGVWYPAAIDLSLVDPRIGLPR